jgi:hypothetical protein
MGKSKLKSRRKGVRLRPSYSTRVHIRRRILSTDWRFLVALLALSGLLTFVIVYLT